VIECELAPELRHRDEKIRLLTGLKPPYVCVAYIEGVGAAIDVAKS
jgi:hypothetical protein